MAMQKGLEVGCKSAAPTRWIRIFACVFRALGHEAYYTHPLCPACAAAVARARAEWER